MRTVGLSVVILILCGSAVATDIRQFDLQTTERLGNEISYRDSIAWRTSDMVFALHPELKKIWQQIWVTELKGDRAIVYWCVDTKNGLVPEYRVTWTKGDRTPETEDIRAAPLPSHIVTRFKARQTGVKAAWPKLNGAFGAHYNFEVLDDPDGKGFLVYALAATNKHGEKLLGGHIRVTVSTDGSKAERVDELSKGIIQSQPPGRAKNIELIGTYDPISTIPVETYIYSSKLYNVPIFVGPKPGVYWQIWDGKMHKLTEAEIDEAEKADHKKK